jgi:hypothetical protein
MFEIIAEREMVCMKPSGEKFLVTIRVGKPYQLSDIEWACPVEAEGLYGKLVDIHGVDSFQSLILAIRMLCQLLKSFIENGGRVFWADGKDELTLEELFIHVI